MKRDPSLGSLSRDHHQALSQALRMRRATDDDRAEVAAGMREFFSEHGAQHFRVEEDLLLPALARHLAPDDERIVRILVDHVWIRERVQRLATDLPTLEELHELGDRLDAHVRHEERVVFPLLEEAAGEHELAELGEQIEAAERGETPA